MCGRRAYGILVDRDAQARAFRESVARAIKHKRIGEESVGDGEALGVVPRQPAWDGRSGEVHARGVECCEKGEHVCCAVGGTL